MATALQNLTNRLAERFEMGSSENLPQTLMATAFRGQNVSPEQMTALLVVSNQHGLNPWTNEIYAFPNNGGIVPIVGVDGWSRIMNEHPQFDGMEFSFGEDNSCTCTIYRKDRSRPIIVTEYMAECQRSTQPWKSHPKRMLRHKAMIQCARLAFGFTGIYDQDEAERIVEYQGNQVGVIDKKNVTDKQNVIDVAVLITSEQTEKLISLIEVTGTSTEKLLTAYGCADLSDMTKEQADNAISILNGRLDKHKKNDGEDIPL